ncbi:MAG: DUF2238 domain-containing protein [Gammaproteobacteria bacterium]|nr:MAG: DUF2238 domain-containing protein [Gammaproteobacteria bacterium]RLA23855.1 MAG: DUF2238 domain-containing protein [Gammaproteobacteria bacterium]
MIATKNRQLTFLLAVVIGGLIISGIGPFDHLTWLLEVTPVLIAIPLLLLTAKRFPLTLLVYWLIAVHALILIVGGHYTYAEVPIGFWVQDWLELSRNPYDRLGHLAQGFVPAMVAREILLRRSPLVVGKWLFFIVVCICLAISAFYEFIEWWVAVAEGGAADAFLGTQGDIWDTQWDMFTAFCGAIVAQLLLSQWHDRALSRLLKPNQ